MARPFRCGVCGTETDTAEDIEAHVAQHVRMRPFHDALDAERFRAQQAANVHRRGGGRDRDLSAAARRHAAGEKWDTIAPDYGLSGDRLQKLVRAEGFKTRGRK